MKVRGGIDGILTALTKAKVLELADDITAKIAGEQVARLNRDKLVGRTRVFRLTPTGQLLMKAAKNGGRACIVLTVISGVNEVYIAKNKVRAAFKLAGGTLGSIGGSAAVGALVAMGVVSGPVGWIALAVFVAGVGGYYLGERAGEAAYEILLSYSSKGYWGTDFYRFVRGGE